MFWRVSGCDKFVEFAETVGGEEFWRGEQWNCWSASESTMFLTICKKFVFFKRRKLSALMPFYSSWGQLTVWHWVVYKKDQYKILWSLSVLVTITIHNYCELKQARETFNGLCCFFKEKQPNKPNPEPKKLYKKLYLCQIRELNF